MSVRWGNALPAYLVRDSGHADCMSIGELRAHLTALAERLPFPELANAQEAAESLCGELASAWRGSEHPSSNAAIAATSVAVDQLNQILEGLEEVKAGVARYIEGL
jgi:hypothetical protein